MLIHQNGTGWMMKNILQIEEYLDYLFKEPKCELEYTKDYELLIAVMLSAQTTDVGVNKVTRILFKKYDTLEKLSKADVNDIKEIIKPIGNYNKKASNVLEIANSLINNFDGKVPKSHAELESMKGVGRKTANVVLGELYDIPSLAVDTHVLRVSNRLGLTKSKEPLEVEKDLKKVFKKENWNKLHKQLDLFGRYKCKAIKPECSDCKFQEFCHKEYQKNNKKS